ncbi:leucine-rich repeat domain-containing protein [Runella sp.]|uniref:leucine-rich repeat domain-containing protein n=1 Tax=Runella sp. TaxID=1960881 RepID=UPI003D0CD649
MNLTTRYVLLLLWLITTSQGLKAQTSQNPYRKVSNYRGLISAKAEIKAGRPVKYLFLNDYEQGWADSLEQFSDLEVISVSISKKDSIKLLRVFDQLGRLPKLKSFTLNRYSGSSQDTLKIPYSFVRLKNLEELNLKISGNVDLGVVWNMLPHLNSLTALELDLSHNRNDLIPILHKCKNLKSLNITLPTEMKLLPALSDFKSLEYLAIHGRLPLRQPLLLSGLSDLTSLKGLDIGNFRIKGSDFKVSESLRYISLGNCVISESDELLASLNRCPHLEVISMRITVLAPFSSAAVLELPNLKELTFSDLYEDTLHRKPLTGMPDFSRSTQLKVLYLPKMLAGSLPKGLEQMTQLETLDLSGNRLTQLPDLGKMTKLVNLRVNNNQLTELPKTIGKAVKLKTLNLDNNQLSELPSGRFNAVELEYLTLQNNKLVSFSGDFSKLEKLKSLTISGNKLTELPKSLGNCSRLQNLQLSNNELTSLPASIGQLKSLKSLDVSHNPLTQLPETLTNCDSLESLVLANCRLETLPNSIGKLQRLNYLNLADAEFVYVNRNRDVGTMDQLPAKNHNQLRSLPTSLADCRNLKMLDLSRNKYWDESALWPVIQQLHMPEGTVNLTDCNLSSVPMTGWLDTEIRNLQLVNNSITQFPSDWYKAKGIKSIVLIRNKLTPPPMNQEYRSFEERLLLGEEMGIDVPKPFPKTKEMARAYLNQAGKKVNTGDIPRFVEYMKEAQRIDSTEGRYLVDLWGRFYFHTHQYRRAIDSFNVVVERYLKIEKERLKPQERPRGMPIALYVDLRGQSKWKLGDSLGAIKDYELLMEDYKIFSPNLFGRLGVWYKRYRPTAGKSGATFDKAINMYESVQNQPPMVQLSAAEVYFMNDQADKAYEYLFGLEKSKFKPDEKLLADYLLLTAQIAQKQAGEEEVETFEKRLKSKDIKVRNWSYQLFEEALDSLEYPKEQKALISRLTNAMKAQSVLVD